MRFSENGTSEEHSARLFENRAEKKKNCTEESGSNCWTEIVSLQYRPKHRYFSLPLIAAIFWLICTIRYDWYTTKYKAVFS